METNNKLTITILAGGLGKRMKSILPKVLHKIHGKPMLVRVIGEALKLYPKKILIVVGEYRSIIEKTLLEWDVLDKIVFAIQETPLGTGHAVLCTLGDLSNSNNSYNIILNGDCPLLKSTTILDIVEVFVCNESDLQITSISNSNPTGCGRIVKDSTGKFLKIVEEKDCDDTERSINEINIGIYMAKNAILKKYIPLIKNNNSQKEYYLTDIVEIYLKNEGELVNLVELDHTKLPEIANINTKEQLETLNSLKV